MKGVPRVRPIGPGPFLIAAIALGAAGVVLHAATLPRMPVRAGEVVAVPGIPFDPGGDLVPTAPQDLPEVGPDRSGEEMAPGEAAALSGDGAPAQGGAPGAIEAPLSPGRLILWLLDAETGDPVRAATLRLEVAAEEGTGAGVWRALSESPVSASREGGVVRDLPPGRYRLRAAVPDGGVSAASEFVLGAGGHATVTARIPCPRVAWGRVLDRKTLLPVSGARVLTVESLRAEPTVGALRALVTASEGVVTEGAGTFRVPAVIDAGTDLWVFHPEYGAQRFDGPRLARSGAEPPPAIALSRQPRIEGRVLDALGLVVAGARVEVFADGESLPADEVETDGEGRFRTVALPPGRYWLAPAGHGHGTGGMAGARAEGAGEHTGVRYRAVDLSHGGLNRCEYLPPEGADLVVAVREGGVARTDGPVRVEGEGWRVDLARAGRSDRYWFPPLPTGSYRVAVRAGVGEVSRSVRLPVRGRVEVEIELQGGP